MLTIDFSAQFNILPAVFQKWVMEVLKRLDTSAHGSANSSIYIYDLVDQNILCCSESSVPALLGYSPQHLEGLGEFGLATLIHPADLQSVAAYFQRFNTLAAREIITVSYRMQRADQTWCWLRSHDTPLMQARDGFPLKILSLVEDISDAQTAKLDHFSSELGGLTTELDFPSTELDQLSQCHP